jgi:hypothetical protein
MTRSDREKQMGRGTNTSSGDADKASDIGVPRLTTTGLVFQKAGPEPFSGRPLGDPRLTWVRRLGAARPGANRREHSLS